MKMAKSPKTEETGLADIDADEARKESKAALLDAADVISSTDLVEAAGGDAIALMEAAWIAGNSERFRRNNHLMGLLRGYANEAPAMREMQARIDMRNADRAKRAEAD